MSDHVIVQAGIEVLNTLDVGIDRVGLSSPSFQECSILFDGWDGLHDQWPFMP